MSINTRTSSDRSLDALLRPLLWDEYIGQERIKQNVKILLAAASERKQHPEHLLFYGPPGLGKTTLAHLIAKELGASIKVTSGPAVEKTGDLASILTNLSGGDVLFIDEIHRLPKAVEEVLYPAMESGVLDIILGKGPSARIIQLDLAPFTLIAATTRISLLSAPLRSRFSGGIFRLSFYTLREVERILKRSANILETKLPDEACGTIALRSRATPRTANYLLKRCRDFAQVNKTPLDVSVVEQALALLEIDTQGLSSLDREILEAIIHKFGGGPVGIGTIAASLQEEQATVEEVNEPYLIQIGFLKRTPRGRVATGAAYAHLGLKAPETPEERQKKML